MRPWTYTTTQERRGLAGLATSLLPFAFVACVTTPAAHNNPDLARLRKRVETLEKTVGEIQAERALEAATPHGDCLPIYDENGDEIDTD